MLVNSEVGRMGGAATTLTIWQLADSAFPTGGFADSGGLEAAWQAGEVSTSDALDRFVRAALWQTGHGLLPLVSAAYVDSSRLEELDQLCHVFLTNIVTRRASCVQGRALPRVTGSGPETRRARSTRASATCMATTRRFSALRCRSSGYRFRRCSSSFCIRHFED